MNYSSHLSISLLRNISGACESFIRVLQCVFLCNVEFLFILDNFSFVSVIPSYEFCKLYHVLIFIGFLVHTVSCSTTIFMSTIFLVGCTSTSFCAVTPV